MLRAEEGEGCVKFQAVYYQSQPSDTKNTCIELSMNI